MDPSTAKEMDNIQIQMMMNELNKDPFSGNIMMYQYLTSFLSGSHSFTCPTHIHEAQLIIHRIKHSNSKMSSTDKHCYYLHCSMLWILRNASYKQSYKYLKKAMTYCDPDINENDEHHSMISIMDHYAYYRLGKYKMCLKMLIDDHGFCSDCSFAVYNYYHMEQYKEGSKLCDVIKPFSNKHLLPILHNVVYGLSIYFNIKIGRIEKAKKLLRECTLYPAFKNNSIISYCSYKLKDKQFLYDDYQAFDMSCYFYNELICLFKGMIFQFQMTNYKQAIFQFYRCNFYGIHPIHYYRLYQCYFMLRLYSIALKYLDKAYEIAEYTVPSIAFHYCSNRQRILSVLATIKCHVCERKHEDNCKLYACSGCLRIYYCGKRCQKIGWKLRSHRDECKTDNTFRKQLKKAKQTPFS